MAVVYDMSRIDAMEGHEFERFIANLLRKLGYQKVEVTPGSGDQGVDVLAEKDGVRYAIQCKCYSSDLGNTPVQEVNTGKMIYHCHVGVVVTNRYFTQSAREAAKATGVLLWDRSKLESLISQVQVTTDANSTMHQSGDAFTLWTGSPLLRRGGIALKDKEWKKAAQFFDRVLNTDPENAEAYLGLVMAEAELSSQFYFEEAYTDPDNYFQISNNNFRHAKEYAGPELNAWFEWLEKQKKAKREREVVEAKMEQERREAEAEERRQQESAKKYASAREHEQVVCDEEKSDDLYAAVNVLHAAAQEFRCLGPYKDSLQRAEACEQRAIRLAEKAKAVVIAQIEQEQIAAEERAARNKKVGIIVIAIMAVIAIIVVIVTQIIIPASKYREAESLLISSDTVGAAMTFGAAGNYQDAQERSLTLWNELTVRDTISAGQNHTVGLRSDGTVVAVGNNGSGQCDVLDWKNIVAVAAGSFYTVGLHTDGTVVATGQNKYGECNVSNWKNIAAVAVAEGGSHTVGLHTDGTVVATGANEYGQCNVSRWKNIVAVAAGGSYTVGLCADGTVVAVGKNDDGQCNVSNWKNIAAVAAGGSYTLGLSIDGSVVIAGSELYRSVSDWKNIVAITAGYRSIVGLKSDGTVIVRCLVNYGQSAVSNWENIVAISAASSFTVGLCTDGTVVAVGENDNGQCNVSGWTEIRTPIK